MTPAQQPGERVALLVTCLVEAMAPQVARAAAALLLASGVREVVPITGCCGQPAWNSGHPGPARRMAKRLVRRLEGFERVVVPSGSCATMLVRYYPHLFSGDPERTAAAQRLAARTSELSQWLAARPAAIPPAEEPATMALHTSCHALRGVGVGDAGVRCLAAAGHSVCPHAEATECCGFGGMFSIHQPDLAVAMADRKLEALRRSGAATVVAGEVGCLLQLEGRARRRGLSLRFRHLAEVLAPEEGPTS